MKSILIFRKKFWENSGDNYALKQAFSARQTGMGSIMPLKKLLSGVRKSHTGVYAAFRGLFLMFPEALKVGFVLHKPSHTT